MFNFHVVNTAEVNAGSRAPAAPVLSIHATEDMNTLSWTSPYFTDFFTIYWSDQPFTSIEEPGVHTIVDPHGVAADPTTRLSYDHEFPAAFSLSLLYYRVSAYNENGETLSNQVDNYNFKLAIYAEIYKKTLEDLVLRFTPEIRRQYEDSDLWRSFVQSLASELAQSRFEIKEALKQLNIQKAVDVFLNMWNSIIGISRINVTDPDTEELILETDDQYRQHLVDSVFWDKISNLALKKTILLRLGYDGDVLDVGPSAESFKIIPEMAPTKLEADYGLKYFPGETIEFLFVGPSYTATCVSDDGTTLTYSGYNGPASMPYGLIGNNTSTFYATPTAAPASGTLELISMGGFDSSSSMNNWVDLDSGSEGPLDLTVRTYRPTAYSNGGGIDAVNPASAYDTNLNSYATIQAGFFYYQGTCDFSVYGFSAQPNPFTSLNLRIKIRMPVAAESYLAYSLNGGGSWIIPAYDPGPAPFPNYIDGDFTIPLSGSQDLSLVQVRFVNSVVQLGEYGDIAAVFPAYLYDVRIEGSGTQMPGISLWSAEYGGSMKLQYGIARRDYVVTVVPGSTYTLSFDIKAGEAYMRVGTIVDGADLVANTLYAVGHYSTTFVATTTVARVSFYVTSVITAYVDNFSCTVPAPITSGTLSHAALYNIFGFWVTLADTPLEFVAQDGVTKSYGKFISNIAGVLTFEHVSGSLLPHVNDYVKADISGTSYTLAVLLSEPAIISSANSSIRPKLLSNVYSVNLGVASLNDSDLNDIYDEISPLGAIGNVLIKILQDISMSFDDWDSLLGNIPYGKIFFQGPTYSGTKDTSSSWDIAEEIFIDNQWAVGDAKKFYSNDGPDDIIILTRIT